MAARRWDKAFTSKWRKSWRRSSVLPLSAIRMTTTDTSKVPNTSATAASSGSDLNGKAAQIAARTIKERLVELAAQTHGVGAGT